MPGRRKHISWKTKCAAAVLDAMAQRERFGLYPGRWYDDAKKMTEDQFLSLFQWDHNILHETGHLDADTFWNLAPMLIQAHREKSKTDAKVIAKGRRIRGKGPHSLLISAETRQAIGNDTLLVQVLREAYQEGISQGREQTNDAWRKEANRPGGALRWRKIASRGFDKTRRRKMDGTVVKREG